MKIFHLLRIVATLGLLLSSSQRASTAMVDDLVAAAKKEGVINFHAPSSLTPQGAQELATAFNKKYSLNVKVNYFPSSSFTKDAAKIMSWAALGVTPEWDVTTITENLHADLWRKGLHLPFDYRAAGIDPKAVLHNNGSITVSHQIILPAYNKNILAAKDVPKTWDDLLAPKFKEGKLGVPDSTYYFALLALGPWGEKKTLDFVRGLANQLPFLGRLAELSTRLQLGEILVAAMLADSAVNAARVKGAPIVFAEVEPVILSTDNMGVLKGAAHPNGAHLFTIFNVSSEAQNIWEKHRGSTSAHVPGTRINKFMKGKEAVFMGGQDPARVEALANEYSKILGFTR
jgi:iron(III) transport system substrate-binding protein